MWKKNKSDLSACGIVVPDGLGLSISEMFDLLGFSYATVSRVYTELSKNIL